jgi:hypothetical protein
VRASGIPDATQRSHNPDRISDFRNAGEARLGQPNAQLNEKDFQDAPHYNVDAARNADCW